MRSAKYYRPFLEFRWTTITFDATITLDATQAADIKDNVAGESHPVLEQNRHVEGNVTEKHLPIHANPETGC